MFEGELGQTGDTKGQNTEGYQEIPHTLSLSFPYRTGWLFGSDTISNSQAERELNLVAEPAVIAVHCPEHSVKSHLSEWNLLPDAAEGYLTSKRRRRRFNRKLARDLVGVD